MIKKWTFESEELPGADVTLDLDCSYSFDAGKCDGPPERCYPPSEESEITLPKGWEEKVLASYAAAAVEAILAIEQKVRDMQSNNIARIWMEEA